jgi:predicted 3-demethylubiquinone-9 3-methyltransferase (glyoxalase superfamily)
MQPFLMLQGDHAEKAMNFYVSLFDDGGEVLEVTRWQKGEQGAEGSIKLARFRAAGRLWFQQALRLGHRPLLHVLAAQSP